LRDAQPGRRLREALPLDHGAECLELPRVHASQYERTGA
jgi:hypothetical protein